MTQSRKIVLVIGGGGERVFAIVGILKVLAAAGVLDNVVAILGTSFGAVFGYLLAAGWTAEQMKEKCLEIQKHFTPISPALAFCWAPIAQLIGKRQYFGLYDGKDFAQYLEGLVDEKYHLIENLPVKLGILTTVMQTGTPYLILRGPAGEAIRASCAVPILRSPVEYLCPEKNESLLLTDGALAQGSAVCQARDMGDVVIAFNFNEPLRSPKKLDLRNTSTFIQKVVGISLERIAEIDYSLADVLIHPDTTGVNIIGTSPQTIEQLFIAGEEAARKKLPKILRRLQIEQQ